MQVFYVNIGGGEPTVGPDFWQLVDYATAHQVGVKFSTNGVRITPDARPGSPPATTWTCRSRWTARRPRSTTPCADRLVRHGDACAAEPAAGRIPDAKISVVATRHNVGQLDEFKAIADRYGATAADDPAAAVRPRRRRLGRAAPDGRHSSASCTTGWSRRRRRADRGLVLPSVRLRRRPARAQPVRRRAGGVPDRPGRRRLRLPVRDPRTVPRRQRAERRRLRPGVARPPNCSANCGRRRPAVPAPAAAFTTRAGAAAWRPSSSPACRWTAPIRSASRATASRASRRPRGAAAGGRPLPVRAADRLKRPRAGRATRARCRAAVDGE